MFEQYKAQEGSDPLLSTIGGKIRMGAAGLQGVFSVFFSFFAYFMLLLALKIKEESDSNL